MMISFLKRLFKKRKQKSRLNWGSIDLSSKEAVKLNLLKNYLSNFNSKLDNGLNQD